LCRDYLLAPGRAEQAQAQALESGTENLALLVWLALSVLRAVPTAHLVSAVADVVA
jgi:hypothetical protein